MIAYPMITTVTGLDPLQIGVFLGGTIHDVAQVVGAGFSISDEVGETATLVKLMRVTMLAPVVLVFSLAIRARGLAEDVGGKRPPLVPGFVLAFLALAAVNSIGLVPEAVAKFVGDLSRLGASGRDLGGRDEDLAAHHPRRRRAGDHPDRRRDGLPRRLHPARPALAGVSQGKDSR